MDINEDLTYEEQPVKVLDKQVKELRCKKIPLVKILWKNHSTEKATWERQEHMRKIYPTLLGKSNFEDKIL